MNCMYCDNPLPQGAERCPSCGGACSDRTSGPAVVAPRQETKNEAKPASAKDTLIGCIGVLVVIGGIVKLVKWLVGIMAN